ncbi:MAG TPA: RsmE family RNA methyltransferase [Candidatus Saccharimonadales bacterium]|nr:RsmE family RNA methyltransferase [Candidatus Saccharimonadales bacterium]
MHRFFVPEPPAAEVVLGGDQARQIATVLRLGPGEHVLLVYGGQDHELAIDTVSPLRVTGRVVARRAVTTEPPSRITLAVPLLKGDRAEEVIEAASQLGVGRFVPYVSSRSVVKELSAGKLERWRRIARESAETARRGAVPEIEPAISWDALADRLAGTVLVCWEAAREPHLGSLRLEADCSLVIGPEGGLAAAEVELLISHGARAVSLGPRNLRAETAATFAVSIAVAHLEALQEIPTTPRS